MARNNIDPAAFWREYEEKCGEKILSYGLGRYLGGWDEYAGPLWGVVIAAEGSFRFHHFPNENWFSAITRATVGGKAPEEKSFAIKRKDILSIEYWKEKNILKQIFTASHPRLIIRYSRADGSTGEIQVEVDKKAESIAEILKTQPGF